MDKLHSLRAGTSLLLVLVSVAPVLAESDSPVQARPVRCLTHVLERGQTLALLANYYGVDRDAVVQANPGVVPQRLPIGARVQIPVPAQGWPVYVVRAGDNLLDLAGRCGCPAQVLLTLNRISETAPLKPGQPLSVPRAPGTAPPPLANAQISGETWIEVRLPNGTKAWAPRVSLLMGAAAPLEPAGVIETAQRFVGAPYKWGGMTPNGVDCSGYVQEVYDLGGHHLPRLADEQFAQTIPVTLDQALPGDLVFFSTYLPGPSHVGIFLGDGRFLHAGSHGVMEARLSDPYFASRYLGVRRIRDWASGPAAAVVAPVPSQLTPEPTAEEP
jgi:cell wall-associated NlpC family hydrolase